MSWKRWGSCGRHDWQVEWPHGRTLGIVSSLLKTCKHTGHSGSSNAAMAWFPSLSELVF